MRALTAGPTLIMLAMALAGCASREAEPPVAATDDAVQPPKEEAPPMVRPSSADVDWLASGNGPGWRIEIDEGTLLDYTGDYGALRIMTPAPATELLPGGARRWSVATEGHRLTLELSPVACTDDMSGAAYPMTARLTVNGKELRGCGRPG